MVALIIFFHQNFTFFGLVFKSWSSFSCQIKTPEPSGQLTNCSAFSEMQMCYQIFAHTKMSQILLFSVKNVLNIEVSLKEVLITQNPFCEIAGFLKPLSFLLLSISHSENGIDMQCQYIQGVPKNVS